MSLKSDIDAALRPRGCPMCEALSVANKDDKVMLQEALNSTLGAVKLSRILQKNGIAVGVPSIHRHRSEGHS